jgi:hypothetical protein
VLQIQDFEIFDTYLPPQISPPDRRFRAVSGRFGPFSSRFPPKGYLPTPTGVPHLTTLPWKKYATQLTIRNLPGITVVGERGMAMEYGWG